MSSGSSELSGDPAVRGTGSPGTPEGRPVLHRGLKVLGTIFIVLSAVTPASSVFIIAPGVLAQAGTGAVWSFLAAAVIGVFMAFVYAELSSAFPLTGGEYAITARTLGKGAGFLTLGLVLVSNLLILAVIALGVGTYLGVLFDGLDAAVVAAVTVVAAALLAVLDIKVNALVTGVFLAIEMVALVVVTVLGFVHVERPLTDLLLSPQVLDPGSGLAPASIGLIIAATAIAIFAYNGYGSAVYFGEETRDAHRKLAVIILWSLGITVVAEIVPVTAVLMGAADLEALLGSENMIGQFVVSRGGETLNTVISLAIAVAIVNAVIAIMLLSARLLFSTGRDSTWPGPVSRALATIHPRFGTPWVATLTAGVLATACCFLDLTLLLVATGTSLAVLYGALCVAAIAGRRNGSTAHAAYRMPLFPLPPIVVLGALAYVLYQTAADPEFGRPSIVAAVVVLAVSGLYYVAVLRRRGGWRLSDAAQG
ncbi:APC family permease [Pseudonocardia nigra]|uniref:APC family permease n=1 Tax=Pseudonocardia nigra TaxID=1921578 RepID=UPI001C5F1B06|nr:APC family permease [Pseudonocardia nigra]